MHPAHVVALNGVFIIVPLIHALAAAAAAGATTDITTGTANANPIPSRLTVSRRDNRGFPIGGSTHSSNKFALPNRSSASQTAASSTAVLASSAANSAMSVTVFLPSQYFQTIAAV